MNTRDSGGVVGASPASEVAIRYLTEEEMGRWRGDWADGDGRELMEESRGVMEVVWEWNSYLLDETRQRKMLLHACILSECGTAVRRHGIGSELYMSGYRISQRAFSINIRPGLKLRYCM
ncbi:hypothetical protein EVAR_82766_1 [Eumeta japonica]|uniref:Uncharacterized protein n=1 Tax=Eumeta variegata TaxID=151549 RepID=A0A4C1UMR1_EUMVA|nr:hypothetical protein EVAR_82766_1 [Eumeta japonica]